MHFIFAYPQMLKWYVALRCTFGSANVYSVGEHRGEKSHDQTPVLVSVRQKPSRGRANARVGRFESEESRSVESFPSPVHGTRMSPYAQGGRTCTCEVFVMERAFVHCEMHCGPDDGRIQVKVK